MRMEMQQKAIDCLRIAALRYGTPERRALFAEACERYSEKAVETKMEELAGRGYIDYGTSPRGCWLTEKGKQALGSAQSQAAYSNQR